MLYGGAPPGKQRPQTRTDKMIELSKRKGLDIATSTTKDKQQVLNTSRIQIDWDMLCNK